MAQFIDAEIAAAAASFSSSLTATVDVPTHQEGDLLVYQLNSSHSASPNQGGWSQGPNEDLGRLGWRIATDSEPATYSFTQSGSTSSRRTGVTLWAFREFDTENPLGAFVSDTGSSTPMNLGAADCADNDAIIGFWSETGTNSTFTAPSGWAHETTASNEWRHWGAYNEGLEAPDEVTAASRSNSLGTWEGQAVVVQADDAAEPIDAEIDVAFPAFAVSAEATVFTPIDAEIATTFPAFTVDAEATLVVPEVSERRTAAPTVTLGRNPSITRELEIQSITWASPVARQVGTATVFVDRDSDAFDPQYISEDGESYIILTDPELGIWRGTVKPDDLDFSSDGVKLIAQHEIGLTQKRLIGRGRIESATPGQIAEQMARDALPPDLGITPGTFTVSGPLISGFEMNRETLRDGLVKLQDDSNQEWEIDHEGRLNWKPEVGQSHGFVLVEGSDLVDVHWISANEEPVKEIIVTGSDGSERSFLATEVRTHRQTVLSMGGDSVTEAIVAGVNLLDQRRRPHAVVTAKLARRRWRDIREGDRVRMILTSASFHGRSPLVRVLTRTFSANAEYLDISVEVLPEIVPTTITTATSGRIIPALQSPRSTFRHPFRPQATAARAGSTRTTQRQAATGGGGGGDTGSSPETGVADHNHDTLTGTNFYGDVRFRSVVAFRENVGFSKYIFNNNGAIQTGGLIVRQGGAAIEGNLWVIGDLQVNGAKNVVIDDPETGEKLKFYATEAADARLWDEVRLRPGEEILPASELIPLVYERLDEAFKRVIEPPYTIVPSFQWTPGSDPVNSVHFYGLIRRELPSRGTRFGRRQVESDERETRDEDQEQER